MLIAVIGHSTDPGQSRAMVAYALFATGIVFGIATISNDNLQDLKTGQLVGATPWRQQVALVFGVIFGAAIIPPVLALLNTAYGFAGTPGSGPDALAAPQAALIAALAQGMLGGNLNLRMIEYGVLAGALLIAAAAARDRTRDLLAHGRDPARGDRSAGGLLLRSLGRSRTAARVCAAHGRADGDRHDRGRELVRRAVRRHRRGIRSERALRPGGR
jgi:hypothetical protein